jgi:hypothetical protein
MVWALVVLGVLTLVFGAFVLLRFPDRPGGTIKFQGTEVSSKGAGLPLMVLGGALVVAAILTYRPGDSTATTETPNVATTLETEGVPETAQPPDPAVSGGGDAAAVPPVGLDTAAATECTNSFFAQEPAVAAGRVRSLEVGIEDRLIIGPGEDRSEPFGMVLVDVAPATADVLGAVALMYRPTAGFSVLRVVDDVTCQPVGVSLDYAPGVPAPELLGDDAVLRLSLNGSPYLPELNGGGGEVQAELHRG